MNRKWAIDTSPLILLGKISALPLLSKMCSDLVIPLGVAEEIWAGPTSDPANQWLAQFGNQWITDFFPLTPTVANWDLGLGESQVLSWCYQHRDYEAILDDGMARKCALSLQIPIRGTLGILLLAKTEQRIAAVAPLLEGLLQVGYRINARILEMALREVGEESVASSQT